MWRGSSKETSADGINTYIFEGSLDERLPNYGDRETSRRVEKIRRSRVVSRVILGDVGVSILVPVAVYPSVGCLSNMAACHAWTTWTKWSDIYANPCLQDVLHSPFETSWPSLLGFTCKSSITFLGIVRIVGWIFVVHIVGFRRKVGIRFTSYSWKWQWLCFWWSRNPVASK